MSGKIFGSIVAGFRSITLNEILEYPYLDESRSENDIAVSMDIDGSGRHDR
jgi:hypothetical protein